LKARQYEPGAMILTEGRNSDAFYIISKGTVDVILPRAIGARSHTILGIFVMEGVLQGIISWLAAVPVSFLVSPPAARAMGTVLFGTTMDYRYNWSAVFVWLLIVVVISVLASVLPARSATRISVRDSLAYAKIHQPRLSENRT
jgi:putative ABC transport system permease protein